MCDESDRYYDNVIEDLCAELIAEGGYRDIDAATAADALTSMTNGLWQSCLISPRTWDREKAMNAVMSYLRSVFPEHYDQ
jgi:TetR/AcrR family transcriptional repressor of bet genes